jgi:hypothetical protein
MLPFPTSAPYRIDQVGSLPLLVALLTAALVLTATLMSLSAREGRPRFWGGAGMALLLEITLLFGLASWGTSDVTKLSHDLAFHTDRVSGESFWMLAAPLILWLPCRWRIRGPWTRPCPFLEGSCLGGLVGLIAALQSISP